MWDAYPTSFPVFCRSFLSRWFDRTIIQIAIPSTIAQTPPPDKLSDRKTKSASPPNWESIAVSSYSIETSAAVILTAFPADRTGLPFFRNRMRLTAAEMVM